MSGLSVAPAALAWGAPQSAQNISAATTASANTTAITQQQNTVSAQAVGPPMQPSPIAGLQQSGTPLPATLWSSSRPSASLPVALVLGEYRVGGYHQSSSVDQAESELDQQALSVTARDPSILFYTEETTKWPMGDMTLSGAGTSMQTYTYVTRQGKVDGFQASAARDMSKRQELADFVAHTLDLAQAQNAPQVWIELTDHGAGLAGGLFTEKSHMSAADIAGAIADGIAEHAQRHPEDAGRRVDGVLGHMCFELTVANAALFSRVGVRYFAASPETTIAPGIPSWVALAIARNQSDPTAMARAVVAIVMAQRYTHAGVTYAPAAAFDVLDISPDKMDAVQQAETAFNLQLIGTLRQQSSLRRVILQDINAVPGMQRDEPTALVPWHADRPAIELYTRIAADRRLPVELRQAADTARAAVAQTILWHAEMGKNPVGFGAMGYRDAVGPTTNFPGTPGQIDPLNPTISAQQNPYQVITWRSSAIATLFPVASWGLLPTTSYFTAWNTVAPTIMVKA